MSLTQKGVGTN